MARAAVQSNVLAAQKKALDAGALELPVGQTQPGQPQAVDTPPPSSAAWLSELQAEAAAPEAMSPEAVAMEQEAERQSIPSIYSPERLEGDRPPDLWQTPAGRNPAFIAGPQLPVTTDPKKSAQEADGGLKTRAKVMAQNFADKSVGFTVTAPRQAEVAQTGISDIMHTLGATEQTGQGWRVDPNLLAIGSLVTENKMAGATVDPKDTEQDPVAAAMQETQAPKPESLKVTRAQDNASIGDQIFQEYQRIKGVKTPERSLGKEQAETLGSTFKQLWAKNNPDMVEVFVDPESNQEIIQLTQTGADLLKRGTGERAKLFPAKNVRPAKTPLATGKLPGDVGATVVKQTSGRVGKVGFGKVIDEAVYNAAQIPNVVDKQRAKILYSTLLPVLASGDHNTWMAEIYDIGPGKQRRFAGELKTFEEEKAAWEAANPGQKYPKPQYVPQEVMQGLANKVAQETRAVAQERNGANYLSYNKMSFNGRITPQQTAFNPTTSKVVRFVTRNAVPVRIDKGGRTDGNLRQMYAMMLVKKADMKLPHERERALQQAAPQLEQWGRRLKEVLTMTDEQYEAVSQAIEQGIPLNDQSFPQVQPLALDPEADADLINAIFDKGEDGPHFIDGLIDYANYADAMRKDRPYFSSFNAYIDGKTNGLASNGIQMGSFDVADATGVTRRNGTNLLDAGDIRDQLQTEAVKSIHQQGWDGNTDGFLEQLNSVAEKLYSHRPLNKKTTMTFGYGKEIPSFVQDFTKTLNELRAGDPQLGADIDHVLEKGKMDINGLSSTLLGKYRATLEGLLSNETMDARRMMRGAAVMHAAMNEVFSIKSYVGQDLVLAGTENTGEATQTRVNVYDQGQKKAVDVQHYETEVTSAASRNRTDLEGNTTAQPGEYAYGGSLPGPVQSLDAATVAMTLAGPSWKKLKAKSNGNPYVHTIYDAFKMDAAGYDTILEEVNNNWLDATMNWSYLKETKEALQKSAENYVAKNKGRNPNDPLKKNERMYMDFMLTPDENGKLSNFKSKIKNIMPFSQDEKTRNAEAEQVAKKLAHTMRKVGYTPTGEATWRHQQAFVKFLFDEFKLRPQFDSLINKTEANKRELRKRIRASGPVYQYYAH